MLRLQAVLADPAPPRTHVALVCVAPGIGAAALPLDARSPASAIDLQPPLAQRNEEPLPTVPEGGLAQYDAAGQ